MPEHDDSAKSAIPHKRSQAQNSTGSLSLDLVPVLDLGPACSVSVSASLHMLLLGWTSGRSCSHAGCPGRYRQPTKDQPFTSQTSSP